MVFRSIRIQTKYPLFYEQIEHPFNYDLELIENRYFKKKFLLYRFQSHTIRLPNEMLPPLTALSTTDIHMKIIRRKINENL